MSHSAHVIFESYIKGFMPTITIQERPNSTITFRHLFKNVDDSNLLSSMHR